MPIATNPDTGEVWYLEENQWKPAQTAVNPKTKEMFAYDGKDWVAVTTHGPGTASHVNDAASGVGFGSALKSGITEGVLTAAAGPIAGPIMGRIPAVRETAEKAVSNVPASAAGFAKDLVQPVIHPIDTATNIKNIGKGVLQKLGIMSGDDATQYADAVGHFLVERYGSGQAIKKTLEEDPVGMAADLSVVLSAGSSAAVRAPGVVGKLGQIGGEVARAIDPLTAVGKGLKVAGSGAANILGVTTGAGTDAIKVAARAGAEGGEAGKAFREGLTGAADMTEVVNDAKFAINNLRQQRGDLYRREMAKLGSSPAGPTMPGPEKIAAAAIVVDGKLYLGPNHVLAQDAAIAKGVTEGAAEQGRDGFLTTSGRFVDREEATKIASEANQVRLFDRAMKPVKNVMLRKTGLKDPLMADELKSTRDMVKFVDDWQGKPITGQSGHQVLSFENIDKAVDNSVKKFKGVSISPSVEKIQGAIRKAVEDWKELDPAEFHTAEGFDALKQKIGDIRDATQFGTPERRAADEVYNATKATISKQVPEYGKIMKGYEEASTQIREIERELSINPKANIGTKFRKLMSSLRDNVNTNYGNRRELVSFLARNGATHLLEKLAGRTLSSAMPRGLQRAVAGGEVGSAILAAVLGHPGALAATIPGLAAASPALVGGAAYGAGVASRYGRRVGQGLFQSGRFSDQ